MTREWMVVLYLSKAVWTCRMTLMMELKAEKGTLLGVGMRDRGLLGEPCLAQVSP